MRFEQLPYLRIDYADRIEPEKKYANTQKVLRIN